MDEINLSFKVICQFFTIFGWFWLITHTIFRYQYLKKWRFAMFIMIFFGMGLAKIQELFVFAFNLEKNIGMYHYINIMMQFMFFKYINLLVKIKENEND